MDTLLQLELDSLTSGGRGGVALAATTQEQMDGLLAELNTAAAADDTETIHHLCRRLKRHVRESVNVNRGVADDLCEVWELITKRLPLRSRDFEIAVLRRTAAAVEDCQKLVENSARLLSTMNEFAELRTPEIKPTIDKMLADVSRVRREVTKAIRVRTEPLSPILAAQLAEATRPGRDVRAMTAEEAKEYFRAKQAES